jgi:hypothetical protein
VYDHASRVNNLLFLINIYMSLNMHQFIDYTINDHLTIADIKNMKIGEELDVVIWNENFEENGIINNMEQYLEYEPWEFFKWNHHKIIYRGNMIWIIKFQNGNSLRCPVYLGIWNIDLPLRWYPIRDKCINLEYHITPEGITKKKEVIPRYINYTRLIGTTRAGWKGPIMLWDKLKKYPLVYREA